MTLGRSSLRANIVSPLLVFTGVEFAAEADVRDALVGDVLNRAKMDALRTEEGMLDTASKRDSAAVATSVAPSSASAATPQDRRDDSPSAPERESESYESRMNRIARRAHEIYEARGGQHGKAMEDWLQAEREIDAELDDARAKPID